MPRNNPKKRIKEVVFAQPRVRIPPSPTGPLHIGTARTALFNYLFAKQNRGAFILRIEDTDLERSDPKFEKDIIDNLRWLGIEWDEGPAPISPSEIGEFPISNSQFPKEQKYIGDYGPYRQSERLETYTKYIEKLLNEDKAYHCFCTEEELEAQRQYQISIGQPPIYSGKCGKLSKEETKKYLAEGKPSVIRFRILSKKVEFEDLIRDRLEFDASLIGDIVIAKDLATPLYNFAVVVDDFEMKITHVIRGEDHISNTPKQILIQEGLDFPRPKYAHLPLILGPDRTKLSKRHGAVSIADYRKEGYLPETLINFMAFLGWNPGTEREIYSMASLIKEFSLERVQKGAAIFNIKRLDFLNGFYIRQKSIERLTELCLPYLAEAGLIEEVKQNPNNPRNPGNPEELKLFEEELPQYKIKETGEVVDLNWLQKIIAIYQERLKKLSEIVELTDFFFKDKLEYNKDLLKWQNMEDKDIGNALDKLEEILSNIDSGNFTKENLENILLPEAEEFAKKIGKAGPPASLREALRAGDRGYLLWPLRVSLTSKEASAGPFEIAEILGKEKILKRIKEARGLIKGSSV